MIDHISIPACLRDRDAHGLSAGDGIDDAVAVGIDVGRHADAVDDGFRSAVVVRIKRAAKIDDGDDVVPAPADQDVTIFHCSSRCLGSLAPALALTSLEALLGLVDDIDAALAAHEPVVPVAGTY